MGSLVTLLDKLLKQHFVRFVERQEKRKDEDYDDIVEESLMDEVCSSCLNNAYMLYYRPVSSLAILSPPENTGIFFLPEFVNIAGIFFRPEIAGIFCDPKLPEYFATRNCRHIFRPEIAGISSDPKSRAYFPTQNCRHIFRPEISGIFFDSKLPAYLPTRNCGHFFDPKLGHLNLHRFFFYQSNDQGL